MRRLARATVFPIVCLVATYTVCVFTAISVSADPNYYCSAYPQMTNPPPVCKWDVKFTGARAGAAYTNWHYDNPNPNLGLTGNVSSPYEGAAGWWFRDADLKVTLEGPDSAALTWHWYEIGGGGEQFDKCSVTVNLNCP
jgi:hypothetical protein